MGARREALELGEGLKGEGGLAGTLLLWSPIWSPPKVGRKYFSLNPLGTNGAEAKFWLSASNIGRGGGVGGGGGQGGGIPPLFLRCMAVLIHLRVLVLMPRHFAKQPKCRCWASAEGAMYIHASQVWSSQPPGYEQLWPNTTVGWHVCSGPMPPLWI